MKSEQKRRAIQMINAIKTRGSTVSLDAVADLLQELIDAPDQAAGVPDSLREAVEYLDRDKFNSIGAGSILHRSMAEALTAPEAPAHHLEMVNAPTPSVPDEQLQAAFDRGLKAGNEQAIAQQIEIHKLHDLLAVQQPEQSADPETQGQCLGAEYLADAIRAMNEKGQS